MADVMRDVPIRSTMRGITLQVRFTGLRIARLRLTIGIKLIELAAIVMGVGIEIERAD